MAVVGCGNSVLILLVLSCLYVFHSAVRGESTAPGFILTSPRILQPGTPEKICIAFHGVSFDIQLNLAITKLDNVSNQFASSKHLFKAGSNRCIKIAVPHVNEPDNKVTLHAYGGSVDPTIQYNINATKTIQIAGEKHMTFVQTDKPIYKPGQTVKFRILAVDWELKPRMEGIDEVFIKDPSGIRVMQWKNVQTEQGLTSLELPLSKEPVLGSWTIEVKMAGQTTTQTFTVKEYVLPKYEVTIQPPSYVLANADVIKITICAKYTYGKPVKGTYTADICVKTLYSYRNRPCVGIMAREINGCAQFEVNVQSDLHLQVSRFSLWDSRLQVKALVTEGNTGIQMNATHDTTPISRQFLELKMWDEAPDYYKPGLPYHGKVIVTRPDHSPAPSESIEVKVSNHETDEKFVHNYISDSNGEVKFSIPPFKRFPATINIRAQATAYPYKYVRGFHSMYSSNAHTTVKQWYSRSGSFLQVEPPSQDAKCLMSLPLNITYTTPDNSKFTFYYKVMSRGNIVKMGHRVNQFTTGSDSEGPDETIIPVHPLRHKHKRDVMGLTPPPPPALHNITLPPLPLKPQGSPAPEVKLPAHLTYFILPLMITPEMSPLIRVLVYYVHDDGEVVSDSIEVEVEKCFKNKVSMDFDSAQKMPGEETTVTIKAAPESLCAVGIVDKSVHLLETSNQLTPAKIFKALESYDLKEDTDSVYYGGDQDNYCNKQVQKLRDRENKVAVSYIACYRGSELNPGMKYYAYKDDWSGDNTVNKCAYVCHQKGYLYTAIYSARACYCGNSYTKVVNASLAKCDTQCPGNSSQECGGYAALSLYKISYDQDTTDNDNSDDARRKKRSSVYMPPGSNDKYYDSIKAFKKMGLVVMSDLNIETRPCERKRSNSHIYRGRGGCADCPVAMAMIVDQRFDDSSPTLSKKSVRSLGVSTDRIRSYFPETFLWSLENVGSTGTLSLKQPIPDTITEWIGSIFCTNTDQGMGVGHITKIKAFQPFFASFSLPYSVVRAERVPLKVSVFNYLSKCLVIELTLKKSADFEIVDTRQTVNLCVCGNEAKLHQYLIIANTLGKIKVTVMAKSVANNGTCTNEVELATSEIGVQDAVTRKLLVEPEGVEKQYTYGSFFCPHKMDTNTSSTDKIELSLPTNLVPGSVRAKVTVIGDVMGAALSNLDDLLKMPYGCGEQNMVKFAPNIFIMQYLANTRQADQKIVRKAKEFMISGYQRELNYKHSDGSYSAFGKNDKSGSMWLTAFVVKSFAQARPFIYIDNKNIKDSLQWFRHRQLENGCFPKVGRLLNKRLAGGLKQSRTPAALTAYVLIAVLEAGVKKSDKMVVDAIQCLDHQLDADLYTTAIMAYAYTLYDHTSLRHKQLMEDLEKLAISKDGTKHWSPPRRTNPTPKPVSWWSSYSQATSADIEITAYVLLASTAHAQSRAVVAGLSMVRWLSKQRNSYGGFASTQDTVVALQALAQYAALAYNNDTDVTVTVSGSNMAESFTVKNSNTLLLQSALINDVPNTLSVKAEGRGCALVQASVKYNIFKVEEVVPEFALKVGVSRVKRPYGTNTCKSRHVNICSSYRGKDLVSNMAVVEVKMVSGWEVEEDSLELLKHLRLGLKRYEIENKYINFYFDEFTRVKICFVFKVKQTLDVKNPQKAFVKVYDYYDPEKSRTKDYNIKNVCGTKQELPFLKPGTDISNIDFIGQVRLPDPLPAFRGRIDSEYPIVAIVPPTPEVELAVDPSIPIPTSEAEVAIPTPEAEEAIPTPEAEAAEKLPDVDMATSLPCPRCEVNLSSPVAEFCSAKHAYKVFVRHQSFKYPLKVNADMRVVPKVIHHLYTKYNLPDTCKCDLLKERSRLLILTKKTNLVKLSNDRKNNKGMMLLDKNCIITKLTKKMERVIFNTARNGMCDV